MAADNETLAELRSMLAAMYIAGGPGLAEELSDDDPIIVHGVYARTSLTSWCNGDDPAASDALAKIPFRSPYRDWVLILKALMKWPADSTGAEVLLQRVPVGSAFSPLATAAGLALLPDSEFTDALARTGEATRRFAAVLRGWTQNRLNLWSELKRLGDPPSGRQPGEGHAPPPQQSGRGMGCNTMACACCLTVIRGASGAPPYWTKHTLARFIVTWSKRGTRKRPMTPGTYILPGRPSSSICATCPIRLPAATTPLRIALIQRRLETEWHLLDYPDEPWDPEPLSQRVLNQLEESLHFDPDDKPAIIRVITHYRGKSNLKQAPPPAGAGVDSLAR